LSEAHSASSDALSAVQRLCDFKRVLDFKSVVDKNREARRKENLTKVIDGDSNAAQK